MNKLSVELGTLIAGLFGSLLGVGKTSSKNLRDNLLAICGGVSSAYFLTPILIKIFGILDEDYRIQYGIAFLLGMMGLRGVEIIINSIFSRFGEDPNHKKLMEVSAEAGGE